jgi:diguanylate cyclase (GGDEF)-like protein
MFFGQRKRASILPPAIEIEIISRLFGAAPQIICIALGLIIGSAIMAVQTGDPLFTILTAAGVITSALRLVNIAAFHRRDPRIALSLAEARRWEKGYAYTAFAFTLVLAVLVVATFRSDHQGGHVLSIGLVMALTAGSYLRTLRYWICASLSTVAIGTLAAAFLLSGDPLYQALSILLVVYLVSIYEGSDHMVGQIEELLIARRELDLASRHDPLTGLLNRRGIDRILADACQSGEALSVLMLDLDGFKLVNDKLGHAAGDDLLRQVGKRLGGLLRPEDVAGRVGGDEFTIVIRGETGPGFADSLAARAVAGVSTPFEVLGQPVHIGASVGIATLDRLAANDDDLAGVLLRKADAALYEAKRAGRGQFRQANALYSVG